MNNLRDTFIELREKIGSSDPFMTGGHQIKKIREGAHDIPEWTKSDAEIRRLLLRSFPALETNDLQRRRAARWARVIHLYFRLNTPHGQIAQELRLSLNKVKMTIRSIKWAAAGKRADGTGFIGKPKGRPKKSLHNPDIFGKPNAEDRNQKHQSSLLREAEKLCDSDNAGGG